MSNFLKSILTTICAAGVFASITPDPGVAGTDDTDTCPPKLVPARVQSPPQSLGYLTFDAAWGRMQSGNATGVVDFQKRSIQQFQSQQKRNQMTSAQRNAFEQEAKLIECRIRNCCGPWTR